MKDALFPLTSALSLRERENNRHRVGKVGAPEVFERRNAWLPLPEGEGRGEGEVTMRMSVGVEAIPDSRKPYEHIM